MSAALDELRQTYADDARAARAWKAGGGRIVGYVGRAPEALIAAAGFLPYRLRGRPGAGEASLDRYLYPLFNKPQSSRGLIDREQPNAILERLFAGEFDFLDHLLVVADRKDVSQLFAHVGAARAADPALALPVTYFVDRVAAEGFAASEFNRKSLLQLRAVLERWSGVASDDNALHAAISAWNADRAAIASLVEARAQGRLSGPDALAALGAGWFMSKADHARLIHDAQAQSWPEPRGVRVALAGSPLDHGAVHKTLQDLGATVVFDGHDWGEAALAPPIAADLPPFEAIVEQSNAAPSSMIFPLAEGAARLARSAAAAGAKGAIVLGHRGDSLAAFDAPDLIAAFEAEGLAAVQLCEQPYDPDAGAIAEAVAPLIARLTEREG